MASITQRDTSAAASAAEGAEQPQASHFYRVIWRWHFYAGLFAIPILLTLATTGMIYLFKPQLDPLMYPLTVPVVGSPQPYARQIEAVRAAYPVGKIVQVQTPDVPGRTTEVRFFTTDDRALTAFVNPYTAAVVGERDEETSLQALAMSFHSELKVGGLGDMLIELAACWTVVLIITGLYMWWPRKGGRVWGIILPRLSRANRRIFWRDIHAVTGFWGVLIVLFMVLTGLTWTGIWGSAFARIWDQYPPERTEHIPKSAALTGTLNTAAEKTVPWSVERLPMPTSDPAGVPAGTAVDVDSVAALAQARGVIPGFTVRLPLQADGVYTVAVNPNNPVDQATLHIDQYSGKVLADIRFADYALVPKGVEYGIVLHKGLYFGPLNQALMLLACLIVITMSVSALVMWWQRRPRGRLGAPPMPQQLPLWKTAVGIIVVLSLIFPGVGFSLILVLLLDYLVIQRVPRLARAFS